MVQIKEETKMTPENFCYWMKGFFELLEAGPKTPEKLVLTIEQVEMIQKHLKSVFEEKIMFSTTSGTSYKIAELTEKHSGPTFVPGTAGYPHPDTTTTKVIC